MEEQPNKNEKRNSFNWALFLGFCIMALSIYVAGHTIAGSIPSTLGGNFSGTLMNSGGGFSSSEFMSEWEVASFLRISHEDLTRIIESGELDGTYTVFQVESSVMRRNSEEWLVEHRGDTAEARVSESVEYDNVIIDQSIFSRERITEWLHARMDNR